MTSERRGPQDPGTDNLTNATTIPAQLRRRRAASRRLPALYDGRRDPLDPPPRRQPIHVRSIGKSTVEFVGCDQAVYNAIRTLGAQFMRAAQGGAWLVPQSAADDVMALLEYRRYELVVTL
jgi:hypothetical protein